MNIRKIYYLIPLFMLLGVLLILGLLYLFIPNQMVNFLTGAWYGIKAPVVIIINVFGGKLSFYKNVELSGWYNFGFIIGIFVWSSPNRITKIKTIR